MNAKLDIDRSNGQAAGHDIVNRGPVTFYNGKIVITLIVLNAPVTADVHGGNVILGNHGETRMLAAEGGGAQSLEQAVAELIARNTAGLPQPA